MSPLCPPFVSVDHDPQNRPTTERRNGRSLVPMEHHTTFSPSQCHAKRGRSIVSSPSFDTCQPSTIRHSFLLQATKVSTVPFCSTDCCRGSVSSQLEHHHHGAPAITRTREYHPGGRGEHTRLVDDRNRRPCLHMRCGGLTEDGSVGTMPVSMTRWVYPSEMLGSPVN